MRHTPRVVLGFAAAISLTLVVAAGASAQVASLSGPDESPLPAEDTSDEVVEFQDREEALLAYAQCMRDNGVDMDDPVAGEGGGGRVLGLGRGQRQIDRFDEEFRAAQEACSAFIEAALPDLDPAAEQERLEEQLLLSQCIRDSGYPEYPDPAIGEDGRLARAGRGAFDTLGIDPRSEEFRTVVASCRDQIGLEALGPGGGPGGLGRGVGGD